MNEREKVCEIKRSAIKSLSAGRNGGIVRAVALEFSPEQEKIKGLPHSTLIWQQVDVEWRLFDVFELLQFVFEYEQKNQLP